MYICYKGLSNVAGSGIDYDSGPYTAIFPVGSTNASFNLIVYEDDEIERGEDFLFVISSITNGHLLGDPRSAVVTIIDTTGKVNYLCYIRTPCIIINNLHVQFVIAACICIYIHTYMPNRFMYERKHTYVYTRIVNFKGD